LLILEIPRKWQIAETLAAGIRTVPRAVARLRTDAELLAD
jgi:hypothetical protein